MVNTFKYIIDKYKIDVSNNYIIDIPNIGRNDMMAYEKGITRDPFRSWFWIKK